MAKYGSSSIVVEYDDAPGGTLRNMTPHVRTDIRAKILARLTESDPLGTSWNESTPTGHASMDDIEIGGFYDDAATTGPHVVFSVQAGDRSPAGSTRTLKVTWGGGKSTQVETRLVSYERLGKARELTEYRAVLRPTGAPTEV